jgi:hypothetical protein
MAIGILELDKVSHLPFETFSLAAWAPTEIFDCELGFPLGKRVGPADIEAFVQAWPWPVPLASYSS